MERGRWSGRSRSLLFVLLFEYKVLCGDPNPRLPVDLESAGSSSTRAQQTSTQSLRCSHLTFQLKGKVRKSEKCREAWSLKYTLYLISIKENKRGDDVTTAVKMNPAIFPFLLIPISETRRLSASSDASLHTIIRV